MDDRSKIGSTLPKTKGNENFSSLRKSLAWSSMPRFFALFVLLVALVATAQAGLFASLRDRVADYVIVGGGGGGCVIARKLAEHPNNYKVVILERGIGEDPTVDNDLNTHAGFVDGPNERHYHAIGQEFAFSRKHYFPTFEGIGGSTRIYGATAVTGSKEYYDQKMPTGYKWNDMLPVIKSWQDHYCHYLPANYTGISAANCTAFHGKNGPMPIGTQYRESVTQPIRDMMTAAASVIGSTKDYNGMSRVGAAYEDVYKRLSNPSNPASTPTKMSAYSAFLPKSFRDSKRNLEIRLQSKAVRLVYSSRDSNRVVGVQYVTENNGDVQTIYAIREVIVSLGVIGTPRFLQANGIGPAAVLNSIGARVRGINNAVGANLTAHQGFLMAYKINTTMIHDNTYWSANIADFFFKTDGSTTTLPADMQVSVLEGVYGENMAYEDATPGRDLIFNIRRLIDTGDFGSLLSGAWAKYIGLVVFNIDPIAVGSINASSVNVDHNPVLDYGWSEAALQTNGDLAKLRGALSKMRQIFLNSPNFTNKYNISEIVPGDLYTRDVAAIYPELTGNALRDKADEMFIRYGLSHLYHVTGSCRLGECTDLNGRVKGVQRLRVCDNSLLPQPDGNPSGYMYTVCSEVGRRIAKGATDNDYDCRPQYDYFDD